MAIYYTSSSATGGGVGSFADPWTLQEAFDTAVAGDEVRILNDGVYYPTAQIDLDINVGTSDNPISYRGRAADDSDYELATISGASLVGTVSIFYAAGLTIVNSYWHFYDLRLTASPKYCYEGIFSRGYQNKFIRCRFDNVASYAFFNSTGVIFWRCEFDHNHIGVFGVRSNSFAFECSFHDNNVGMSNCEGGMIVANSVFFRNTKGAQQFSGGVNFISCTFDNNVTGIDGMAFVHAFNCVFSNNSTYGINIRTPTATYDLRNYLFVGNYFYNNGIDINGSSALPDMAATNTLGGSDPLYVDTTSGSENYALQPESPLIAAGLPGTIPYADYQAMTGYGTPGALMPRLLGGGQVFHPLGFGG